jgi:hypothetical protein
MEIDNTFTRRYMSNNQLKKAEAKRHNEAYEANKDKRSEEEFVKLLEQALAPMREEIKQQLGISR